MVRKICKECGRSEETEATECKLCGGEMMSAGVPKSIKPKKTRRFTGESDLNRESPGDFTPVAVRSIKEKVPNRTVLNIGKQEKTTTKHKLVTAGAVVLTIILAFTLAMSIRHFFGEYNVKFGDDNNRNQQTESE